MPGQDVTGQAGCGQDAPGATADQDRAPHRDPATRRRGRTVLVAHPYPDLYGSDPQLVETIADKLVEDIFNAAVANW